MSETVRIDVFCEDRAHEELLTNLIRRLSTEEHVTTEIQVRSARGGHGRAISEFVLYQNVLKAGGLPTPDLAVVAIDTNCKSYAEAKREIESRIDRDHIARYAIACPNPHIELWYMADPDAFERVVGSRAQSLDAGCGKASRHILKRTLETAVREAGHPVLFGGIEFAPELAEELDLVRAGKADAGFRHFVRDVHNALRQLKLAKSGS